MPIQALCFILQPSVNSNSPKTPNSSQLQQFFVLCDLEILQMTMKNNRTPLLCYFKLWASFHNHRWIHTWVIVWKSPIWVKICELLSGVTLKFDGWSGKTIRYLFYAISSCVHHFDQSQNWWPGVQLICSFFDSWQLDNFWLRYSKFHVWPWKFQVKVMMKINQNLS